MNRPDDLDSPHDDAEHLAHDRQPDLTGFDATESASAPPRLTLKPQEISLDHPDSCNMFQPRPDKPFVATPAALKAVGIETILRCLTELQVKAALHKGLDYLQVFVAEGDPERKLWFIEDGPGGAITALLPSDY
jgi:hypothetical protein